MSFIIRKGTEADVSGMMRLVKELALYERAPEAVVNTETMLLEDGFGKNSIYRVFVAEDAGTNDIVGMALYYTAYSTWKGKIFFLDDLVVTERYRKFGIGKKLLDEVLKEANAMGVEQIRWQVLDWNEPAIAFYKKIGAELDPEWITCKMSKAEIAAYLAS
ncbi:MAG: GNAT family N-acetyltransferase [Chitinophagales bacterium]|jgi:GNAT superfamily N-acetyltransferase|nr:GNAT family N-acetyltransferase [Chitinophagales bacterium]